MAAKVRQRYELSHSMHELNIGIGIFFFLQESAPLQSLPLGKVVLQVTCILRIVESCQVLVEYLAS